MMMPPLILVVMVAMAAVSAAFGLEGNLHLYKIRSEATEHILDHMVGPNAQKLVSNFRRQMPVSQMPRKAHKLMRVFMPYFDNKFGRGLNPEPSPIFKLQAISIGHGDRFRKVEKDVFALIRSQANATAMACVEVESERACCLFLRPMPGGAMNGSGMHSHIHFST
jgi:hypothetical protein